MVGKNGLLFSFDFYKAFDTLEWEAIYLALDKFGFGSNYIDMVRVLYKEPLICVANNGHWSGFFKPTRATRQGCCYSLDIFNLVVELLGLAIRQNDDIKGINLNGQEIKSGQYANDLWTALEATPENLQATVKEMTEFGALTGLRINVDKCAVLKLGPFKNTDMKYYTLKRLFWSPGSLKILGVQVYLDQLIKYSENFVEMLEQVEGQLNSWKYRTLTIYREN